MIILTTDKVKTLLLNVARQRFGTKTIVPCGNRLTLNECFTYERIPNTKIILVIFWYGVLGERSSKTEFLKFRGRLKPRRRPKKDFKPEHIYWYYFNKKKAVHA